MTAPEYDETLIGAIEEAIARQGFAAVDVEQIMTEIAPAVAELKGIAAAEALREQAVALVKPAESYTEWGAAMRVAARRLNEAADTALDT